jgi:GT2 family glycosyltransferase
MTPDTAPSVCAVVVAYGDSRGVERCVTALRDCPNVSEIVVVDNGGDRAIEAACSALGAVYIDPGSNLGYGRAADLAVRSTRVGASHVLVVNPDLVLHDLAPVLRALDRSGAAVATGCLRRNDASVESNTRVMATPLREIGCAVIGTRAYASSTPDLDGAVESVEQAAGSLLLMTREVWDGLGGFDERFELYYEDVDLCRRARRLGGVVRVRTVVADHAGGVSYGENRGQAYVALRVSRLRYLRKWYGIRGTVLAFVLTLIEVVSRGTTRQAEGWRARFEATAAHVREIKAPGAVSTLSR